MINATRSETDQEIINAYWRGYNDACKKMEKTDDNIKELMKDAACKVFQEILIELCPELLGYGAMAVYWENDFRKRLEEQI